MATTAEPQPPPSPAPSGGAHPPPAPDLSYLIVNTGQRELLLRCLESVFATATVPPFEVLVLDNCSEDGSASAVRERFGDRVTLLEIDRRRGKAENDTRLLEAARGRYALLLNEDTEVRTGAVEALRDALETEPRAAAAGARLLGPDGSPQPSAWRFPGVAAALAGAFFLHRRLTVQSRGGRLREVDWVQSAAMMVRRRAFEEVGGLDRQFFLYSDEVDWQRRMRDAGWTVLYVPAAEVVHHEMLAGPFPSRRIVEFCRNRDRYVRKHHGAAAAAVVRVLTAWTYAVRAAVSLALPGRSPRRYWLHARRSLRPGRGGGLREAADELNARRAGRPEA